MFWSLLVGLLKFFLAGAIIFYAGLVLLSLRSEWTENHLRLGWARAARSEEQLLLWAGVKVVRIAFEGLNAVLNTLEEASADVGEWLLHHRGA
jgi:hypothetical protein